MSASAGKILIVDDDAKLRRVLHSTLHSLGFEVMDCASGEQAMKEAKNHKFDVVLLDVNMTGMGGVETCRALRRTSARLQILMLTVRESDLDKVQALDAGADDYVTKPFSMRELTARIRAAIRRATTPLPETQETIVIGHIELDPIHRVVRKAGEKVHLTPKEFELLHYLMAHAGTPITHARLLHAVWGAEHGEEREYLRTFVHELRRKLEDDPTSPEYLVTEAYLGYRFRAPDQRSS